MAKRGIDGFSNDYVSLKTLAASAKHEFPILVKTSGLLKSSQRQGPDVSLPAEAEMLIEGPVILPYAVVRSLDFDDDQKMMSEKGEDFVLEHNNFVGEKFLMPLGFDKKLNIVQHPKRRGRYGSIAEVIDDLPRYVRVEQDTVSIPPPDCVRQPNNRLVPAETKLELKYVQETDYVNNDDNFLECSDENNTVYFFKETSRINFTSVPDTKLYTLEEMVNSILLPKVAMFQQVSASDVIEYDDELAYGVLVLASGPVEVLCCERKKTLACWIQEKSRTCCNLLVLIPEKLWSDIKVQRRTQESEHEQHSYIKKNFPCYMSHGLGIVKDKLYVIREQEHGLKRLLPKATPNAADDSDSSNSGYESPVEQCPPLPPRTPRNTDARNPEHPALPIPQVKINKGWQKIVQIVKDKAESGFNKVHTELVSVVRKKSILNKQRPKLKPKLCMRSLSEGAHRASPLSAETISELNTNRPLPELPSRKDDHVLSLESISNRPLPQPPSSADDNGSQPNAPIEKPYKYDYVDMPAKLKPPCISVEGIQNDDVSQLNESERKFYSYTMSELAECFNTRGLQKLGELCRKEKLDGPFFCGVDWKNLLREEPFSLTSLDIKKVESIIKRGWFPK